MRAATDEKPIYVYYQGTWRRYAWTRDLIAVSTLGDVICDPDLPNRDEPASEHLYPSTTAHALVIAAQPPEPSVWKELDRILDGDEALVARDLVTLVG